MKNWLNLSAAIFSIGISTLIVVWGKQSAITYINFIIGGMNLTIFIIRNLEGR